MNLIFSTNTVHIMQAISRRQVPTEFRFSLIARNACRNDYKPKEMVIHLFVKHICHEN